MLGWLTGSDWWTFTVERDGAGVDRHWVLDEAVDRLGHAGHGPWVSKSSLAEAGILDFGFCPILILVLGDRDFCSVQNAGSGTPNHERKRLYYLFSIYVLTPWQRRIES